MKHTIGTTILMLLFFFGTMPVNAQTKIHINKSDGTSVEYKISDVDSIIFVSTQAPTPSNYTLNSGSDLSGILSGIAADIAAGRPSNVAISFGAVSLSGDTQGTDLGTLLAYRNTNPSVTFTGSLTIVAGTDRAMLPESTVAALYNFGGKITQSGTAEFHIPNPDMNQLSFVLTGGAKVTRNRANDLNLSNFNVAVPDTTVLTAASGNSDGLTQYITNWYSNIGNTGLYQPVLWTNNVALNSVSDYKTLEQMWYPNMDPFFVSNMRNAGAQIKIDGGTLIFKQVSGGAAGWANLFYESPMQYSAAIQRAGGNGIVSVRSAQPIDGNIFMAFNANLQYPQSRVKKLADGTIVNMNNPNSGTSMVAVTLRSFCIKYTAINIQQGPMIIMNFYCIVVPDYIYDTFASNPNWGGSLQRFLMTNAPGADLSSVPPNPYVISETMAKNMGVTPHDVAFTKWDNWGVIQLTGNGRI